MKVTLTTIVLATAMTLCSCDTTNSRKIDAQIGQTVAHMVQAQTLDPAAAAAPPAVAPEVGDGQRLKSAMDQHRSDVPGAEQKVSRPIVFEVGNR